MLAQFEREVAGILTRDELHDDAWGAAALLRLLIETEGIESPAARAMLRESGIRDRWNHGFAVDRASAVTEWLHGWIPDEGRVLDLLAGDCRLTARLAERLGRGILGVDRAGCYADVVSHPLVEYRDVAEGAELPRAATVLLCAVLHHEEDPARLRDLALTSRASRYVVVENCVDERFGGDFHLLMDLFYNRCLNDFGSACTREHRTLDEWSELLAPLGELVHRDELPVVPGLPFPYQLMVFER